MEKIFRSMRFVISTHFFNINEVDIHKFFVIRRKAISWKL